MSSGATKSTKISIVTLSFNQVAFLKEALDSVLLQNYPHLEYIVLDPGSTDGSRELIEQYRGRLAQIVLERDRGAAHGLNKGFKLATGDVFGFLNADDILLPGSLERVGRFFQEHLECDIAFGNGYVLDANGRVIRHVRARGFTVHRCLHGGTHFLQQSTFFRRAAYLRSPGFNEENRTCWDGELFLRMRQQGARVEYIRADLGGFRMHNASISGSDRLKDAYRQDRRRIFREVEGRGWRASDEFWRNVYRAEKLAIKLATCFDTRRKGNAA